MPSITRLLQRVVNIVWVTFALVVVAAALLVGVARMLLPLLDDYRPQVEQLVSAHLERRVEIDRISASWHGLHPNLELVGMTIYKPGGDEHWMRFDHVRASLSLWNSLRNRQIEIGQLRLSGADLEVARHRDGSIWVSGVKTGGNRKVLTWLLNRDRVLLSESKLRLVDPRVRPEPLQLAQATLRLGREPSGYRISGSAQIAHQPQSDLKFILQLSGDPRSDVLAARFYVQGDVDLASWQRQALVPDLRIENGQARFKLWGWLGGERERVTADIDLRELQWDFIQGQEGPRAPVSFGRVSGQVFWARMGGGWHVDLQDLAVQRGGRLWPTAEAHLRWRHGSADAASSVQGTVSFARIQDIRDALVRVPGIPETLTEAAAALQPAGDIHDLNFLVKGDVLQPEHFYLSAGFEDAAFRHWRRMPGIQGAQGRISATEERAYIDLDAQGLGFEFPRLFRNELALSRGAAEIYVSRRDSDWMVRVPWFEANSADIETRGRLAFEFPGEGGSPFLDMQVDFGQGKIARTRHYLPVGIMPPKVVKWLDDGLAGGRVTHGAFLFFGHTDDFPFENRKGTFRIDFGIEDAAIDYGKGWPRAEQVDANVTFEDRSFQATVRSGKILGLDVTDASLAIDEMSKRAAFEMDAHLRGAVADMVRYLRISPVAEEYRDVMDDVEVAGDGTLALSLYLPLRNLGQGEVSGKVGFADSRVALPEWKIELDRIRGALDFDYDRQGVRYNAKRLEARFRGRDARVTVDTVRSADAYKTLLEMDVPLAPHQLLGGTGDFLRAHARGESQWRIRASVAGATERRPQRVDLRFYSTLEGTQVLLPGAFGKSADGKRPFVLTTSIGSGGLGPMELVYGDNVRAAFTVEGTRVGRGAVQFGGQPAQLPDHGIVVSGELERLSASSWQQWYSSATQGAVPGGLLSRLSDIDLAVGELQLFGQTLHRVRLNADRQHGFWQASIESDEMAGTLHLPETPTYMDPYVLDLDYLDVGAPGNTDASSLTDPSAFPPLEVRAERFTLDEVDMGSLELVARPSPGGLKFEQLDIESPHFLITAAGDWNIENDESVSGFRITASTSDLGDALRHAGYAESVAEGEAVAHIDAHWPGPPAAFELAQLDGTLRLLIKNGRLLEVDPGGGRVFGLLSVQALPRRLALDFSDVSRKGFSFDRIEGSFAVADGEAYTNDLYMQGPAARVEVSGRIGLVTRDYDETVIVTPEVSSTMPLLGGLAGGPGVGLGLWVAERVFGKEIDKMTRVRYSVTGTWSNPIVQREGEEEAETDAER